MGYWRRSGRERETVHKRYLVDESQFRSCYDRQQKKRLIKAFDATKTVKTT